MHDPWRSACAAAFVLACGSEKKPAGQGSGATAAGPLEVHPSEVQLRPKQAQQFSWTPTTVQVSWSVAEANGGTVSQAGVYTAPNASGVFHVVATATGNVSGQAVVTVDSGVRITAISPVAAFACEPVTLSATVSGSADTGVVWSAPAACGTITAAGVFTSLRGTGACQVTAQAHADPAQAAAIAVNVSPERVLGVAVLPASATVGAGGTKTFGANVTTACGTFPSGT